MKHPSPMRVARKGSRARPAVGVTALMGILACGGNDQSPTAVNAACERVVALPVVATHVSGPPPTEDFSFDSEGYLLALSGGASLVRVARGEKPTLVNPNVVAQGRGLRTLPGGDVVIADRDRGLVVRVDARGGVKRLTTNIDSPNGVELGPGGALYVSDFGVSGNVFRVDPDTGETTIVASPGKASNGLAFSPDLSTLYVGDHDAGTISRMSVNAAGDVGQPSVLAAGIGTPDGLAVDACGDLYAASLDRRIYRITSRGDVDVVAELPTVVSAVRFGSGKHGWDARRLYAAAPKMGGVFELDVGRSAPPVAPPQLRYRTCELGTKTGELRITRASDFTAVGGSIASGVVPVAVPDLAAEAGGCRLLRRRNLFCDPACRAGQTCGQGGTCVPYPLNVDVGTIVIEGLARTVSMRPTAGAHYADTTLPHPGFAVGANIRLHAAGNADVAAFDLGGWGVTPLQVPLQTHELAPERSLSLQWTAGPAGPARVAITISIDQHGTSPSTLVCDSPDIGAFDVPAPLITALLAAGASGYPTLSLTRQTVDARELQAGCVELVVSTGGDLPLKVAGHVPCRAPSDCPADRTCDVRLQTCR